MEYSKLYIAFSTHKDGYRLDLMSSNDDYTETDFIFNTLKEVQEK